MTLTLRIPEQQDLSPRITVFGIGGAGGNAVNNMIVKNLEGADFVVANTDAQALQQSSSSKKLQLGTKITEGLGAGARPELGTKAAEESIEEIIDILEGSHLCFITAGMGGGTGTGAAPVIAQAARQLGVLTVGVVTKPFQFEGAKRMRQAEAGIEALQKVVDTLIIIPNQNLFRVANEKTTFTEAFSMADDVLYQGVKGVTDLMVRPGLINLDFADVRSVMDEMGKAMMGTGEASGEDRAIQAAEKAIANPLLDEISLKGARGVLINITGGNDMTLFELDEAANRIRDEVDPEANIIIGSTLDSNLEGTLRVSVVATGIDVVENRSIRNSEMDEFPENSHDAARARSITNGENKELGYKTDEVSNVLAEAKILRAPKINETSESIKDNAGQFENGKLTSSFNQNEDSKEIAPLSPNQLARERLIAAVQKQPDPESYRRPIIRDKINSMNKKVTGGAFNNLLQRMTGGHKGKLGDLDKPFSINESAGQNSKSTRSEQSLSNSEDERLEIPAFLRRQAN
jgi:cell division protein FtsZ